MCSLAIDWLSLHWAIKHVFTLIVKQYRFDLRAPCQIHSLQLSLSYLSISDEKTIATIKELCFLIYFDSFCLINTDDEIPIKFRVEDLVQADGTPNYVTFYSNEKRLIHFWRLIKKYKD